MSRFDHASEAETLLQRVTETQDAINAAVEAGNALPEEVLDAIRESVNITIAQAHAHATLALVEQQRIANLIDLYHQHADRETREALWTIEEGDRWSLRPEIASALGIGGGSDG